MSDHLIRSETELLALLGPVGETSLRKEVAFIHPIYRQWIEASPFAVIATVGPDGLDVSPRGDAAPLVRVCDERTLLLPERRGNNRADSLRNLLTDSRISLLFFVPGVGETIRVNGRATISVDPALLASFAVGQILPRCVLRVDVDAVFFQCARAMLRSELWKQPANQATVPTAGEILAAVAGEDFDAGTYDRELPQRQRATLY